MVRALKIRRRHIVELVAVGNTTMRDILFGIDVEPIGQKPYKSHIETDFTDGKRDTTALNVPAHELGIRINPNANIYSGPIIASHIGSDIAADLLTIAIDQQQEPIILIDIGTNTEIIAGNKDSTTRRLLPRRPSLRRRPSNLRHARLQRSSRTTLSFPSPSRSEGDAANEVTPQGVPGEARGGESPLLQEGARGRTPLSLQRKGREQAKRCERGMPGGAQRCPGNVPFAKRKGTRASEAQKTDTAQGMPGGAGRQHPQHPILKSLQSFKSGFRHPPPSSPPSATPPPSASAAPDSSTS